MMKMMPGLTNQPSKVWHFPLCRILVSLLTSRALSWPDGFPVCHFASLSTHSSDLLGQTPIPLPCHYRSVQMIVITGPSQHHEAAAIELGESVLSGLTWSLIETLKVKKNKNTTWLAFGIIAPTAKRNCAKIWNSGNLKIIVMKVQCWFLLWNRREVRTLRPVS